MGVYFGETEITNIDNLVSQTMQDITQAFFGSTEVFTVWGKYDCTLPAQYSANGSMLADYRIYGAAGGVGDRTENEINVSMLTLGYTLDTTTGLPIASPNRAATLTPIIIDSSNAVIKYSYSGEGTILIMYSVLNGNALVRRTYSSDNPYLIDTSGGDTFYLCTFVAEGATVDLSKISNLMLTFGSTAPAEYVPYGYEVDMSVSDGTTSTTTPIYIGSSPLGEDEYVDYGRGKVYRRTENIFTQNGETEGIYLAIGGVEKQIPGWCASAYIPVSPNETYTFVPNSNGANDPKHIMFDANYTPVGYATSGQSTFTTTADTAYMRFSYRLTSSNITLTPGSTAPAEYIPYLQPTDPPVPLPQLPTVNGTTITNYAGQSAAVPSRFVAKYRKEGF